MKIEVIKPNESAWIFPCKGRDRNRNLIVGFTDMGEGVILESSNKTDLFKYSKYWDMSEFEPIYEQSNNGLDWEKAEFPIWVKDKNGDVLQIDKIEEERVWLYAFVDEHIIHDQGNAFGSIKKRNEWLNSLEILPKGTKIEITL